MSQEYTTIKIKVETHPRLKILAAKTGESMMDLIDRLVKEEAERDRKGQDGTRRD